MPGRCGWRVVLEGGKEVFLADVPVQRVQGGSNADKAAALDLFHFMPDSPQTFGKKFVSECWQIMARNGLGRIGIPVPAEARFFRAATACRTWGRTSVRILTISWCYTDDTSKFNAQNQRVLWMSAGKHRPGQLDSIIVPIPKGIDNLQLAVVGKQQGSQALSWVAHAVFALHGRRARGAGPERLARRVVEPENVGRRRQDVLVQGQRQEPAAVHQPSVVPGGSEQRAGHAGGKRSELRGRQGIGRFTGFVAGAAARQTERRRLAFPRAGRRQGAVEVAGAAQAEPLYFDIPIAGVENLRLETEVVGMVGNHQPVWVEPSLYVE